MKAAAALLTLAVGLFPLAAAAQTASDAGAPFDPGRRRATRSRGEPSACRGDRAQRRGWRQRRPASRRRAATGSGSGRIHPHQPRRALRHPDAEQPASRDLPRHSRQLPRAARPAVADLHGRPGRSARAPGADRGGRLGRRDRGGARRSHAGDHARVLGARHGPRSAARGGGSRPAHRRASARRA